MKSQGKDKEMGRVNVVAFFAFIFLGLVLVVSLYCINKLVKLGVDNTLTGYMGLVAAPPTAYLWIIRERKKERELKNTDVDHENKIEDQYQVVVSELNKVQIEALNLFYDQNKQLAGAFALNGLIDEWIYLSTTYKNHQKDCFIKIEQIASILFTKDNDDEKHVSQYKELLAGIVVKLIDFQNETDQIFDWSKFKSNLFTFGYSMENLPGIELRYKTAFVGAQLLRATFIQTDFSFLNLEGMCSNQSNFKSSYFNEAILSNGKFIGTNFQKAKFTNAKLKNANLQNSNFNNACLPEVDLRGADLRNAEFNNANLSKADLRGAKLNRTNFTSANLKGAKLEGAVIEGTFFDRADITDIDLNGKELKNANLFGVIIKDKKLDSGAIEDIKAGNLKKYFI